MLRDTMVLRYDWPPDRGSVRWSLVSSTLLQRRSKGRTPLRPSGSGTDVTYELAVDVVVPMIGLLKRKAERRLTERRAGGSQRRVEGGADGR